MKETFKNIKKVYSYGKEFSFSMFCEIFGSIIGVAIGIILPIYTAEQLVHLTDNSVDELIYASIIVLVIQLVGAAKTVLIRKNTQKFHRGTMKKIQVKAENEILKIKVEDIDKNTSGLFINRLNDDTGKMCNLFTSGMGYLTGIITDIGIFVAVYILSKEVFVYYLCISIILVIFHLIRVKKYTKKDKEFRKQTEKLFGLTGELVRGIRDIKMLNAKDTFMKEIELNTDDAIKKNFAMRNVDINYNFVIEALMAIFEFILVLLVIYLITNNQITIAVAIVLFSYRNRVMSNLMDRIGKLLTEIKGFNLSCNRVFELIDNNVFEKETFGDKHLKSVKGNFEFKNVNFSYDGVKNILEDLSFKINANETVAFVGKSGAGKTSIFSLLCKLYDIQKGEILIDGININELDEDSIRGNITIISQNPYIFNMSIKDNLRLVKKNLTNKEMIEACKMACLDDFIETLPDKYDTVVGESGITLSGGQRQRLAIARAFVQKTKIILFDEATSALDNETQYKIQQAINNMKKDYTILIIAHRLSTVVNSNRILFIEDGKVKDEGTHEELLKNNKSYKTLYETELIKNN